MILYHPAYDVHHCTYRLIGLLRYQEDNEHGFPLDALRLSDFYYTYPHLLKDVALPRPFQKYKKNIKNIPQPLEFTPNSKHLFYELSQLQDSAIDFLSHKCIIKKSEGAIFINEDLIPEKMKIKFGNDDFMKTDFFFCLAKVIPKIKMDGKSGFKSRTGLMEYRYD